MAFLPPDVTVRTFRDAVGIALELADEFAQLHAGLLLDPAGRAVAIRVTKLGCQPGAGVGVGVNSAALAGPEHLVQWFLQQPHRWPQTHDTWRQESAGPLHGSALLISVGALTWGETTAPLQALFRRAHDALEPTGRRLLDWIETDGDCIRSHAYLTDPLAAWQLDPPPNDDQSPLIRASR